MICDKQSSNAYSAGCNERYKIYLADNFHKEVSEQPIESVRATICFCPRHVGCSVKSEHLNAAHCNE